MSSNEKQKIVQQYNRVSNVRGFLDLAVHWGSIVLIFSAIYHSQSVLIGIIALPIIAGLQNSLGSLAHETFHHKVFTARTLNTFVGRFFYSYPLGVPYESYRRRHLDHHRKVGQRDDPDWGNYQGSQFESRSDVYRFFTSKLFGAYLLVNVLATIGGKQPPLLEGNRDKSPVTDVAFLVLTQLILFALVAIFFTWWMYIVFWLVPVVTLTSFLIGMRAYLEHNDPNGDSGIDGRLFDYSPGALEHFLVSPCHFHLHAIHHAFPAVPHYRLESMKKELGQYGISYPCQNRSGYVQSFFTQLKKLPTRPAISNPG